MREACLRKHQTDERRDIEMREGKKRWKVTFQECHSSDFNTNSAAFQLIFCCAASNVQLAQYKTCLESFGLHIRFGFASPAEF